jgi:hypothetical protein
MIDEFLDWFARLPSSSASFLGTLTGSSLGLLALLSGALFNAYLNRKRDDRLRREEARTVASAIKAELFRISVALLRNADSLENPKDDFVVPDIAHSVRVMPTLVSKLGLLDAETTGDVIDKYVQIEQYHEHLLRFGGQGTNTGRGDRWLILMPIKSSESVARYNRLLAESMQNTIKKLDTILRER